MVSDILRVGFSVRHNIYQPGFLLEYSCCSKVHDDVNNIK